MTAEFVAIVAVGVSLAGLIVRLNRRIDRLEDRLGSFEQRTEHGMAGLRERMARLEGLLEGLREAIGRAAA